MNRKSFAIWFINNVKFDCESCRQFDSGKNCQNNKKSACVVVKKYLENLIKKDIDEMVEKRLHDKCEHCKFEDDKTDNKTHDKKDSVSLRRYKREDDSYVYYIVRDQGQYNEYDSYDIETKIEYCPICGCKL